MLVDHIYRHLNQLFNCPKVGPFAGIAKGKCRAKGASPRRSANPVNITFRFIGQFEIHDMCNIVDIYPSGSDVGRDQHPHFAVPKGFQCTLPGILRFVAVDCFGLDPRPTKLLRNTVGSMLGPGENNHSEHRLLSQKIFQ